MTTRTYTTRTEAINREIIEPLQASGYPVTDWDTDTIADKVLSGHEDGYALKVTDAEFWEIVAQHDTTN